jgi:hypothetical protein
MKLTPEERRSLYLQVFNTDAGQQVLADLERIANSNPVNGANPDSNAAIYKVAQLALIQTIKKTMASPKRN